MFNIRNGMQSESTCLVRRNKLEGMNILIRINTPSPVALLNASLMRLDDRNHVYRR